MYTFLKLGGSIITDKSGKEAPDLPLIQRLAAEIAEARVAQPDLALVVGHGSGSFGHHYAALYGVHQGLAAAADWFGFAHTAAAALRLNRIVVDALIAARVPALSLQPSATLLAAGRSIAAWHTEAISRALNHQLVPIIHGDVAFDSKQGSAIISTEALLAHLALQTELRPSRIILVGEDAVYTADPRSDPLAEPIPLINAANLSDVLAGAGGSHAVDVTGGMRSKLELMWQLIQALPELEIAIIGPAPGLLRSTLLGEPLQSGTLIKA
jgi:isopentenyl phosphate kinase